MKIFMLNGPVSLENQQTGTPSKSFKSHPNLPRVETVAFKLGDIAGISM